MENNINTTVEEKPGRTYVVLEARTASQEQPRPAQKVTWKVIVICVVVSAASAVLSAYLTLERVSRGHASDLSEAAELARTLREDWRQLYQQSVDERAALEARVNELKTQVNKLAESIKQSEKQLALVQASTPSALEIRKRVETAGKTDAGLRKQAKDILGDLGVRDIRILDSRKAR